KLRLQFMDLKERVSPEEDFRKFSYYCRKCQFVYEFTHDSRLVGFFVVHYDVRSFEGIKFAAIELEYSFFLPQYRRLSVMPKAYINAVLRVYAMHPFLPVFIFGSGYVTGYLMLRSFFPSLKTLFDKEITPWEKGALLYFSEEFCGDHWCKDTFLYDMATIPKMTNEEAAARYKNNIAYDEYMRVNPEWDKGYAITGIIPFYLRDVFFSIRTVMRRNRERKKVLR
ncbi:MAG: hypothetical protein GY754_17200, partial [bacterium]|nr:hypothetical protein [bacterium]